VRIRDRTESDLDALPAVNRAAFTDYGSEPCPTEFVRAYRRLLSDPACVVFLDENEIEGSKRIVSMVAPTGAGLLLATKESKVEAG
jgi:hypothetical protein